MLTNSIQFRAGTRVLTFLTLLALPCAVSVSLFTPAVAHAQERDHDRHDSRGERRRERDDDHVRFTHSLDERRFDNGVALRRGVTVTDRRFDAYFPHHVYSYPHYVLTREPGRVVVSPFSFYVGVFPPYIERSAVIVAAPPRVFIDVPIYVHDDYQPAGGSGGGGYYLNRRDDDNRWKDDPELSDAVYNLEDTFRNDDIALLAPLTDPNANIAIFTKGRYQYSLPANDYLDMTRDFLRSAHTTTFAAYRVHRKAPGVYQVFARHTYQDQDGTSHTVYLCIVLQRLNDRWTITQIDSSPAHLSS
jgi:hypothetical protein